MSLKNIKQGLTFDDVLLIPKYSEVISRSNIDLSVDLGKGIKLHIPIVSANMKNVTESAMAAAIATLGGLGILHRFCSIDEQIEMFRRLEFYRGLDGAFGASIGVKVEDQKRADCLAKAGCSVICIDVAHGHHSNCIAMTQFIAREFPHVLLIAGNVATAQGAKDLSDAGADVIKVGVGGGSLCTTRIETGNGVPQLTALEDVYEASKIKETDSLLYLHLNPWKANQGRHFKIIADGGIRRAGDVVKALCFSDAVMLGNLLAGTDEAPGEVMLTVDGARYKQYAGSSTHKTSHVEGVAALVPCKGPVENVINRLLDGITSGLSYQGCADLNELKKDPQFVSVSHAGLVESHPHDVMITKG